MSKKTDEIYQQMSQNIQRNAGIIPPPEEVWFCPMCDITYPKALDTRMSTSHYTCPVCGYQVQHEDES